MENKRKFRPDPGIKLMDQVRQVLRYHHYSYRTEKTYCDWIVRYIKYFETKKHPRDMGKIGIGVGPSSEYSVDLLSPLMHLQIMLFLPPKRPIYDQITPSF